MEWHSLAGKPENSRYPYVTAGDRLYSIGNQAGEFPEIGFHVPGEMGGIWQHPIKLLDSYSLGIVQPGGRVQNLPPADAFTTTPLITRHDYQLEDHGLQITRSEFVPDSLGVLVVEYTVHNTRGDRQDLTLRFTADVDLRPVWLGEENGMTDHLDTLDAIGPNTWYFRDGQQRWHVGVTADIALDFVGTQTSPWKGNGVRGMWNLTLRLDTGRHDQTIRFFIAGSDSGNEEVAKSLGLAKVGLTDLYAAKSTRLRHIEQTGRLNIPDEALQEAYEWGKYTTDWLVRDVPALGKGLGAGLPDYPWFFSNDQAYTFEALTGLVDPSLFYASFDMLKRLSDSVNSASGRIIHEASTNGVVYDRGRMEESQLHLETAWKIFKYTGNMDFLRANFAFGKRTLSWLMEHDTDNNLYVEGYGGVEIKGLDDEMLDVAVHTQAFFGAMANMAEVLGERELAADYREKADTLKHNINRDWWVGEEHRYADFIADKDKALELIDSALVNRTDTARNRWAQKKLLALRQQIEGGSYPNKGYLVYYNTPGILPLSHGIADTDKAMDALAHIHWFTNKYGLYIAGIERPDDLSIDEQSVYHRNAESFKYDQAVMPAATAKLAIAACQYGAIDSALHYMHKLLNSFSFATPGTMYEVSPDYGMFVQAWNIVGINVPLIRHFFGIDPLAHKREITVHTQFPETWNYAELDSLCIGDNFFSIAYRKNKEEVWLTMTHTADDWRIVLELPENAELITPITNCQEGGRAILEGKKEQIVNYRILDMK